MTDAVVAGLFWLWPLLVVVGVVLLGYVIVQAARGGGRTEGRGEARRVLDERFARSEIDEEEYLRRRSALRDRSR